MAVDRPRKFSWYLIKIYIESETHKPNYQLICIKCIDMSIRGKDILQAEADNEIQFFKIT